MNYPRIVVDTNKILAAALKQGWIRTLLYQAPITPITPAQVIREAEEHAGELAGKTGLSPEEFLLLVRKLIKDTATLVDPRQPYISRAKRITNRFDPDDWPFIALALQEDAVLWTNDREIIREAVSGDYREYTAVDTTGLQMILEGKSNGEVLRAMKARYLG